MSEVKEVPCLIGVAGDDPSALGYGGLAMRVEQLMHTNPAFCSEHATLEMVVTKMRKSNGDFIPITDGAGRVIGVVTGRDAAVALAAGDRRPSEVGAAEAMTTPVATCEPTDTIHRALQRMARSRVRRLVVVNPSGGLVGVLALGDVIPVAQGVRAGVDRVSHEQLIEALTGMYAR